MSKGHTEELECGRTFHPDIRNDPLVGPEPLVGSDKGFPAAAHPPALPAPRPAGLRHPWMIEPLGLARSVSEYEVEQDMDQDMDICV